MDIKNNIQYDHEKIKKYIFDIEALGRSDSALRKPLFNMLRNELLIVQKAEEATLYDALEARQRDGKLVDKLETENETIRSLLKAIKKSEPNSDEWHDNFVKLKHHVINHFDKEERKLLPNAEKALPTEEVAQSFDDKKRALWNTKTMVEEVSACEDFSKTVRQAA